MAAYGLTGLIVEIVVLTSYFMRRLLRAQPVAPPLARVLNSRWEHPAATRVLQGFRAVVPVYMIGVIIEDLASNDGHELLFYTFINYVLLLVYFILVNLATFVQWWGTGVKELRSMSNADSTATPDPALTKECQMQAFSVHAAASSGGGLDHQKSLADSLARLCQIFCSIVACTAITIDVLTWCVLYPKYDSKGRQRLLRFASINMHVLNLLFILVEVVLNDIPSYSEDVVYVFVVELCYALLIMLRVAIIPNIRHCLIEPCHKVRREDRIDGFMVFPYFFLDTSAPNTPVYYLALVLVHQAFFFVAHYTRRALSRVSAKSFSDVRGNLMGQLEI